MYWFVRLSFVRGRNYVTNRIILMTTIALLTPQLQATHLYMTKDNVKCTANDPRQIYPNCMLYSVDLSLWCDQSNYSRIPRVREMNRYLPYKDSTVATAIFVNDSCITTIAKEDLYEFKKISVFDGDRNRIKTIEKFAFAGNQRLTTITLCSNEIESVHPTALSGLRYLKSLNMARNRIAHLESGTFRGLHSLQTLLLDSNHLHVLQNGLLNNLVSLRQLQLTDNIISHIERHTFAGLKQLTHLRLDGNRIKSITADHFRDLRKLEVLTMSHNRIHIWPPESGVIFTELHTLNLGNNMVSEFKAAHVANMSKLQNLSLENNSLKLIDETLFRTTPRLGHLNLGSNYLEEIPRNAFKPMCHLKHLVLSDNRLKTPRREWFEDVSKTYGREEYSNISGNRWQCDCEAMEYRNFLQEMREVEETGHHRHWTPVLDFDCFYPKKLRGRKLSSLDDNELECPTSLPATAPTTPTFQPTNQNTQNCSESPDFETIPLPPKFKLIIRPSLDYTTTELPEKAEDNSDMLMIIISIVIASVLFVMVLVVVSRKCTCVRPSGGSYSEKFGSRTRKSRLSVPVVHQGSRPSSRSEDVLGKCDGSGEHFAT